MSRHYMCLYAICLHSSIYYRYALCCLYNIYVYYIAIHYMYLYNTCLYTIHTYTMYDAYTLYVYELCVSMHYICLYIIHDICTLYVSMPYMCLYTPVLGKQTDPWRWLASVANQWIPGSVKDTRKSDREGLLTLTSGLHTCTQI